MFVNVCFQYTISDFAVSIFCMEISKSLHSLNIYLIWTGHFVTEVINVHDFEQPQTCLQTELLLEMCWEEMHESSRNLGRLRNLLYQQQGLFSKFWNRLRFRLLHMLHIHPTWHHANTFCFPDFKKKNKKADECSGISGICCTLRKTDLPL